MSAVVVGIIPASSVDACYLGLGPRQCITQPSCETAIVLSGEQFHTVGFSITRQDQTFYLNFTAEGFAVTIVQDMIDFAVVTLDEKS